MSVTFFDPVSNCMLTEPFAFTIDLFNPVEKSIEKDLGKKATSEKGDKALYSPCLYLYL